MGNSGSGDETVRTSIKGESILLRLKNGRVSVRTSSSERRRAGERRQTMLISRNVTIVHV